jgi:hypothetical protein
MYMSGTLSTILFNVLDIPRECEESFKKGVLCGIFIMFIGTRIPINSN